MPEGFSLKDKLSLYEEGKHRRYTLLFSVNGGAFAVAKLLVGAEGKTAIVLGQLTLPELSWGMILFTVIMVADVYAFGYKMSHDFSLKVLARIYLTHMSKHITLADSIAWIISERQRRFALCGRILPIFSGGLFTGCQYWFLVIGQVGLSA